MEKKLYGSWEPSSKKIRPPLPILQSVLDQNTEVFFLGFLVVKHAYLKCNYVTVGTKVTLKRQRRLWEPGREAIWGSQVKRARQKLGRCDKR